MAANRLQACTFLGEADARHRRGRGDLERGRVRVRNAGWRAARSGRDGPPHAGRHAHLRGPAPPARRLSSGWPARCPRGTSHDHESRGRPPARDGRRALPGPAGDPGRRASRPGSSPGGCGRRSLADARRAMAEGAGLLELGIVRDRRSTTSGSCSTGGASTTWRPGSRRPPHSEWWRAAVERMRLKRDIGVYHETFLVRAVRHRVDLHELSIRPAWRRSASWASPSAR